MLFKLDRSVAGELVHIVEDLWWVSVDKASEFTDDL
jgi:hypothetical protein